VVRNNEVMRLKYLLVYAEKKAKKPSLRQWGNLSLFVDDSHEYIFRSVVDWLLHHKITVMVIIYAFILISVSLYNSRSFHYHVRRLFKSWYFFKFMHIN
jgi:multidrug efflux pump subunit AcrB